MNTEDLLIKSDWPWRIIFYISDGLDFMVKKLTRGLVKKISRFIAIPTILVLLFELPTTITLAVQKKIPEVINSPLFILFIGVAILLPITAVLVYNFYQKFRSVYYKLWQQKAIIAQENQLGEIIEQVGKYCNQRATIFVCSIMACIADVSLVLFSRLTTTKDGMPSEPEFLYNLPMPIYIYNSIWIVFIFTAVLIFAWKALVIWYHTRKLIKGVGTQQPHFSLDLYNPDDCGGLKNLSYYWLNINLIVVFMGIWIIGSFIADKSENTLYNLYWLPVCLYAVIGALLFFALFLELHSLMSKLKNIEVDNCYQEYLKSSNSRAHTKTAYTYKKFQDSKHLPTWPLNINLKSIYLTGYLIPFLIPLYEIYLSHLKK
jgi:hypothetical protein